MSEIRISTGFEISGTISGYSGGASSRFVERIIRLNELVQSPDAARLYATEYSVTQGYSTTTDYSVSLTGFGPEGYSRTTLDLRSYVDIDGNEYGENLTVSNVVLSGDGTALLFAYRNADGTGLDVRTISTDLQTVSQAHALATITGGVAPTPHITSNPNGGFTVFWTEKATDTDTSSGTLFARDVGSDGTPTGTPTTLLTLTEGLGNVIEAKRLDTGAYVVTYESIGGFQTNQTTVIVDNGVLTQLDVVSRDNNTPAPEIRLHDDGFYLLRGTVIAAAFNMDGTTDSGAAPVIGLVPISDGRFASTEYVGRSGSPTNRPEITFREVDIYDDAGNLLADGALEYQSYYSTSANGEGYITTYALSSTMGTDALIFNYVRTNVNATLYGRSSSYRIALETGIVVGDEMAQTIDGFLGGGTIYAMGGNDIINGSYKTDIIDGGAGADTMNGSAGADTYIVDNIGDVILGEAAYTDIDVVFTSVNFTLPDGIETGVHTVTGAPVSLTGNAADNTLIVSSTVGTNIVDGGAGNDIIYAISETIMIGGSGNDVLVMQGDGNYAAGGSGNDTYIVQGNFLSFNSNTIAEVAGEGQDIVYAFGSFVLPEHIEGLILVSAGPGLIHGTGNASDNTIIGTEGTNFLAGLGGADYIIAGAGDDVIIGGTSAPGTFDILQGNSGADTFYYNAAAEGGDIIQDFVSAEDNFAFSAAAFGFDAGETLVDGVNFFAGTSPFAQGAEAAFLFDTDDTALYYDADGLGGQNAVLIADLQDLSSVTVDDIIFF